MIRLLGDGVCNGRRHIAVDAALFRRHADGLSPDTIRLFRFEPTVLVGRFQALRRAAHVERCAADGVALARRLTGGGAVYIDEGQICWGLVCSRGVLGGGSLADGAARVCGAVAAGLSRAFGIDARYRAPGDVEVGGRKLGGSAGAIRGDTVLVQGTVLTQIDGGRMLRYLDVPAPAVQMHASRLVTLRDLIGCPPPREDVEAALVDGFRCGMGIETIDAPLTPDEQALADRILADEIGGDAFVLGTDEARLEGALAGAARGDCGFVQAFVRLDGDVSRRRIREVVFSGDFDLEPARALYDLEASLRGLRVEVAVDAIPRSMDGAGRTRGSDLSAVLRAALRDALAGDKASRDAGIALPGGEM